MDADAGLELEFLEENARSLGGEIVLGVGERGIGAGEFNTAHAAGTVGGNQLDVEHVAERNGRHQRFEFVEASTRRPRMWR